MKNQDWNEYRNALRNDQLIDQYELRLRIERRMQNLRYCVLGSAIGSFLFWAFWAAVWW